MEELMIGTYGTIDFTELLEELSTEIARLKNGYCVHDIDRASRVNDYNNMVSALLILRNIVSR